MHMRMHASPYGSELCNSHQFDPQMWGDPIRAQKWSRCGLLCVRFLVRTRTGGEPREIAEVCASPAREPEMAGAFACARKHLVCTCMCVRICVSMIGACMDACKLICACECAHACMKGCSISSVSLLSIIAGHISEVSQVTSINTTTIQQQQQQHSNNNIKCVSNEQGGEGGSCINDRRTRKDTCDTTT